MFEFIYRVLASRGVLPFEVKEVERAGKVLVLRSVAPETENIRFPEKWRSKLISPLSPGEVRPALALARQYVALSLQ